MFLKHYWCSLQNNLMKHYYRRHQSQEKDIQHSATRRAEANHNLQTACMFEFIRRFLGSDGTWDVSTSRIEEDAEDQLAERQEDEKKNKIAASFLSRVAAISASFSRQMVYLFSYASKSVGKYAVVLRRGGTPNLGEYSRTRL